MSLNITALKATAKATTLPPSGRGGKTARNLGPNPFLDKTFPFNLQNSYDKGEAYEITVAGAYVDAVYTKGVDKGKKYKKLTGDAADAVTLLRDAADELKLGVSIPMPLEPGKTRGTYVVKYRAQKRKAARKSKPAAVQSPTPATPVLSTPAAPALTPAQGTPTAA